MRGGSVWRIDRDSLVETEIIRFKDAQLGECSLSADGEWITAAIKQGAQAGIVTGRADGTGWRLIPFGRTVIHPQFHPLEPEWLIFAGDPAPRMFRVRRDGRGMECLHEHGNDEFIVHETFLGRTGEIVFTVWPRLLCRMDWTTRAIREITQFNAWHIASNRAGTEVLCDTNHPDRGIFLIDVATGEQRLVCMPDSSNGGSQWRESRYALAEDFARARSQAKTGETLSWMEASTDTVYGPQWTHPHPSFSFDERQDRIRKRSHRDDSGLCRAGAGLERFHHLTNALSSSRTLACFFCSRSLLIWIAFVSLSRARDAGGSGT